MSLSQDPAFSILKEQFVCGYHDISHEKYAGASGKHLPDQNAVDTTNGAGPHNIQMFVLAPDGTVLTCLPGYWHSQDLADELAFAATLQQVWANPEMSLDQKKAEFQRLQLARIQEEAPGEAKRSHMQGFDIQYEAQKKLAYTDVFYNPRMVDPTGKHIPPNLVKTTDVIMHERMAARPFVPYKKFDVAAYADYGKPVYDKHEMYRTADGSIPAGTDLKSEPMIGNDPRAHPVETQVKKSTQQIARAGLSGFLRYGLRAALYH